MNIIVLAGNWKASSLIFTFAEEFRYWVRGCFLIYPRKNNTLELRDHLLNVKVCDCNLRMFIISLSFLFSSYNGNVI